MAFCPYCGSQVDASNSFCPSCGAPLTNSQPQQPAPQPQQQSYQQQSYQQQSYQQPAYQQTYYQQPVAPYATGGLVAWSIVTLLLCTIPGIVALVNVGKINKAATVEEQQKAISTTKTWCIVGTILGILFVIGSIAQNM